MPMIWKGWSVPKSGNTAGENDDAWKVQAKEGGFLVAVSDGATESIFSKLWARKLTECATSAWIHSPSEVLDRLIDELRNDYHPLEEIVGEIPWFTQNAFESVGSQATVLLGHITPSADAGWNIHAAAYGDSCLIVLRPEKNAYVYSSFPLQSSASFGNRPKLITNHPQAPLSYRRIYTHLAPDDIALFCTDAISQWILAMLEAGRGIELARVLPGLLEGSDGADAARPEQFIPRRFGFMSRILGISNAPPEPVAIAPYPEAYSQAFPDWINACRKQADRPMKNDDTTMVVFAAANRGLRLTLQLHIEATARETRIRDFSGICIQCRHSNHGTEDAQEGFWACPWLGATRPESACRILYKDTGQPVFEEFNRKNGTWNGSQEYRGAPAGFEDRQVELVRTDL